MHIKVIRYTLWGLCLVLGIGTFIRYKDLLTPTARIHTSDQNHVSAINIGGPFALKDESGALIKSTDSNGKIRLVYFGYTYCPDLCPLALHNISDALKLLQRDRENVETFFITIDPKRDTQEVLKLYHSNFHPSIHMLRGEDADLKPIMESYKVFSQEVNDDKMSDYLIDHSTFIYILNRKGEVVDVLPHTTPGAEIMHTVNHHLFMKDA